MFFKNKLSFSTRYEYLAESLVFKYIHTPYDHSEYKFLVQNLQKFAKKKICIFSIIGLWFALQVDVHTCVIKAFLTDFLLIS